MGVADSALILYKDRRMDSDAVLEAVGRDQQQLRLHISFDAAHLRWELVEAETELAQCLSEIDSSRSFTPNWIVRTLNAQQDTLLRKYDIRYVAHRTKDGKALSLRWDGVR